MRDAIVLFLFLFNIGARLFPLSFLLFFFFVFFSFRKRKRVFDLINSTVCCCSFIRSSRFFVLGLIYQLYYTRTICSTTCCWQSRLFLLGPTDIVVVVLETGEMSPACTHVRHLRLQLAVYCASGARAWHVLIYVVVALFNCHDSQQGFIYFYLNSRRRSARRIVINFLGCFCSSCHVIVSAAAAAAAANCIF